MTSPAAKSPPARPIENLHSILDRRPRLRRYAFLIPIGGFLAAYAVVAPHLPRDHDVSLRFPPEMRDVTDVEVTWTRLSESEDALAESVFHFAPGAAPRDLRVKVRSANGEYWLDLTVVRRSQRHALRRRVTLEDKPIRVDIPVPSSSADTDPSTDRHR